MLTDTHTHAHTHTHTHTHTQNTAIDIIDLLEFLEVRFHYHFMPDSIV